MEAEREEEPPKEEEVEEEEEEEGGGSWMVSKSPMTVLEAWDGPGAGKEEGGREKGCCVSKSRMTVWETGGPRHTEPEATNIGWTVSNND